MNVYSEVMDQILKLFKSSSTSLSTSTAASIDSGHLPSSIMVGPYLQSLPAEILHQIFIYLDPQSLISLSRTSELLRKHSQNDLLWARIVRENVPGPVESPAPCLSWKDLYVGHYPYWFLPRHKIWFSDKSHAGSTMTGNVIVALYDPRRGCLEAYRLVAEHGPNEVHGWDYNPQVIIHTFNPKVRLWRDDPVIKLYVNGAIGRKVSRMETPLPTGAAQGICSAISLCQIIPDELQEESMALWPPAIFPAPHRVRSESPTMFRGEASRPQTMAQASDRMFRIRRWIDFRGMRAPLGVRIGEDVTTFSTLPQESFTPTKERPWQGIWVGDYAGHGCEFLVILQKDVQNRALDATSGHIDDHAPEDGACSGRLEAMKLTGDPNVPRGEYTWIAEDIGPKGLIRIADEEIFKGARVVKSRGNTANRGYRNPKYISSQLIMISHNSLAQYWEEFGHISFYARVNIDDFLNL